MLGIRLAKVNLRKEVVVLFDTRNFRRKTPSMMKAERRDKSELGLGRKCVENGPAKKRMKELLGGGHVRSWRTIMLAFQSVFRPLEKELQKEGCSVPRFQVLFHLYFDGPMAAIELAERLFVTRGNISMFLKRLESEGLTRSVPDALGRKSKRFLLALSPAGVTYFERIFPAHVRRVKRLMPELSKSTLLELQKVQGAQERASNVYI